MKKVILVLYLGIAQFCPFFYLKSVQKGSETAVSIEPHATFPSADSDNKMLAFGWFRNGFTLEDENTSCTFDSVFPVSGTIDMNGGTLYLTSDLQIENITLLGDLGKIYADGHILTMDSSVERLMNSDIKAILMDVDFFINSDLNISSTIRFNGNCYINGNDRNLSLDPGVELIVGSNSTLTLKNVTFTGVHGYNVRCLDETGTIILDNTSYYLDADYNFTVGSVQMMNNVEFCGSYTLLYDSAKTFTIHKNSLCLITGGATMALRVNSPEYGQNIGWFEDETSQIEFLNASLMIGEGGIITTRGTVIFDGKVNIDSKSTNTANGLIFGNGSDEGNIIAKFYPAARVNFNNCPLVYNITTPNNFQSSSSYSKIIRGSSSVFYLKQDMQYADVTIKTDPTSEILTEDGKHVSYTNCTIDMPTTKFSITGARYDRYTSVLDGNDEIFISDGILPLYTLVKNSGNSIKGNGDVGGGITLYDSNAQLSFCLNGQLLENITLNGGTIILTRDLEFAHEKTFIGDGTVDLSSYNLKFGINDLSFAGNIYWDGNSGSIEINSDVTLSGTMTFSGDCKIQGNGNTIKLDPSATIIIERGSTLLAENLNIYGLKNTNVKCLDDAGTIKLDNGNLYLIGNYNFETGKVEIENNVQILGSSYKFAYKSKKQSIIKTGGTLGFNEGTIFSYDPVTSAKDLIQLESSESTITLKRATLHSTTTGIQLTKGNLEIKGVCPFVSEATCIPEGMVGGDGILEENDLKIKILDSSNLEIASGVFVLKNLN